MKLVVLGSGTSVPHAQRAAAAHWLETNAGSLLLDIGPDTAHRLAQENLDWPALDAIWVSHFHLDHLGGLAPFLLALKWAPQTRDRTRRLKIFGPVGIKHLLDIVDQSNHYRLLEQRFVIEVIEIESGTQFEILPGLRAQTFSTSHTSESLAIRLTESGGSSLVYTSDTGYAEKLAEFAKAADLLLMECSFRRDKPLQTHLELAEAMRLVHLAEPKRVVLTHLYPEWDGVDLAAEAKLLWPGETITASDGLRLQI
jgi:ribonuclease BN (tRNA processing enzyme)